jgi:hypothetical protein
VRYIRQVTENQPVPPSDHPARAQEERPVLDRRKRERDRALRRTRNLVPQRDDPEHRDDADENERAFEQSCRHVADRELFVEPPHDRDDHDRGADVRDDEQQFQQRAEQHPLVVPGTRDEGDGVVEHGDVEQRRRDGRGERDEVEHAEDSRALLIAGHPVKTPSLSSGRWRKRIPTPPLTG